jgi:hypothetical protein
VTTNARDVASIHPWFAFALVLALLGGTALGIQGWQPPEALRIVWFASTIAAVSLVSYRAWRERWRAYDPGWLVELARRQHPDKPWLAEALTQCTRVRRESNAYLRFVSPRRPNKPGSAWQFAENVLLEDEAAGDLVLDVLKHQRVGGVEFLSRLL